MYPKVKENSAITPPHVYHTALKTMFLPILFFLLSNLPLFFFFHSCYCLFTTIQYSLFFPYLAWTSLIIIFTPFHTASTALSYQVLWTQLEKPQSGLNLSQLGYFKLWPSNLKWTLPTASRAYFLLLAHLLSHIPDGYSASSLSSNFKFSALHQPCSFV